MDDKTPLSSRAELGKTAEAPTASDAQDAVATLVRQLFAGTGVPVAERRALQGAKVAPIESEDARFDTRAFESALADLQSDIVDQVRCGVLAYIRQKLLPVMEDAINHGADSLLRADGSRRPGPGAAASWPANRAGPEAAASPGKQPDSSVIPPLFGEQAGDGFWNSADVETVQPPASSELNGVYEGTVTLRVRASLDVLNAWSISSPNCGEGRTSACLS